MIRFRTFQSRVVFFFLGLLSLVQVVVFLTVDITNTRYAKRQIEVALEVGAVGFNRLIEMRTGQLLQSVRILAADPAFRSAASRPDLAAAKTLLQNFNERVRADLMMLVTSEQRTVSATRPGGDSVPEELRSLLRSAESGNRVWGIITISNEAFQVVVHPVQGQGRMAWLVAGYSVGEELARDLQQFTKLGNSFIYTGSDGRARVLASSLPV